MSTWEGLSPPYRTIVADPPWPYREAFVQMHSGAGRVTRPLPYSAMTVADICELPVWKLTAPDARLFLWTTNRFLPAAFEVLRRWHFVYRQTLVWHKDGNPSPWGGSVAPNAAEFLLVATFGKPRQVGRWPSNVVGVNVGRHSAKPGVFLDLVEAVSEPPFVELFARAPRLGWDSWGHGYENFAGVS